MSSTEDPLADLVKRCTKAEATLEGLIAEATAQAETRAQVRLAGKQEGVALVRGYIEEVVRDAARIAARAPR